MQTNPTSTLSVLRMPLRGLMSLLAALAGLGSGMAAHGQAAPGGEPDFVPGELLIKLKPTASAAHVADAWQRGGLGLIRSIEFQRGKRLAIRHASTRHGVPQALRALENHPAIEYVQPNYYLHLTATPADPQFSKQWGLHNTGQKLQQGSRGTVDADVDAPEAWNITTGSHDVLIGVLDWGIDISHPDLSANIWVNPDEVSGDGIDNDGNGYIDDIHGWDFTNDDNTVYDLGDGDHGTAVAGVIAAVGNNGIGVAGVNWQAKILPLRVHDGSGIPVSAAIQGMQYAANKGARVLNASFGRYRVDQALREAIEASGIIFVASAGNDATNNDVNPLDPASIDLPNIIAVAATDKNDRLAAFSNYGAASVDLGAPGEGILTTLSGNQYGYLSGTSFAAPHVAGVAGLIYARFPQLTPIQVKDRILAAADPIPALSGITLTGGRLNAFKALLDRAPSVAISSPPEGAVLAGSLLLSATATDDAGVTEVRFYLDGATLLGAAAAAPYEVHWDSSTVADGTHGITAVATDTAGQTASHMAMVLVDNYNDPPTPDAGPDQMVMDAGNDGVETVTLDGSSSSDPDGAVVAYQWSDDLTVLGNTDVLAIVLAPGSYSFTLTVTDDGGATASDTVVVDVVPAVTDLEVFSDSFEDGTLGPWTQDSQNDWFVSTQRAADGVRCGEVDGAASDARLISPLLALQGRAAATVTFSWFIESGLDAGEYLACDVSTDGGATWSEAARLRGNVDAEEVWHARTVEVAAAPWGTIQLRFRGKMDRSDEDAFVDALRVVAH